MVALTPRFGLLAAAFGVCVAHGAAAQTYTVSTITVPNSVYTTAVAINAAGTVLGTWYDATYTEHGYLYQNGTVSTFDEPNAVFGTVPAAINAKGEVVGSYFDSSFTAHGFTMVMTKKKPVFTSVDAPGSASTSLLAFGAGGTLFGGGVGVDNAQYIFTDAKGSFNTVIGNGSPSVLGSSSNGDLAGGLFENYPPQGYVYVKGAVVDLPTSGYTTSIAYGVNKMGVAVGTITSTAGATTGFTFTPGKKKSYTLSPVAIPNSVSSYFTGINDSGTIVGIGYNSSYTATSYVYSGGTFTPLAISGAAGVTANGINDAGQIIGTYTDASYNTYAFVATP